MKLELFRHFICFNMAPPSNRSLPRSSAAHLHLFPILLALRVANALTLRTFFQPDEYFQSLEPAWRLVFGEDSGAWITWEWRNELRTSLHPLLFAAVYQATRFLARASDFSDATRASFLLAAPKAVQAIFAASIDYFTWKCAQDAYGPDHPVAWVTLSLSVLSPWQLFCSVRTLSNSLEVALTVAALFYWPWPLRFGSANTGDPNANQSRGSGIKGRAGFRFGQSAGLRTSLLLAAFASILRPTNILVWIPIALQTLWRAKTPDRLHLISEAVLCGSLVLTLSILADRYYYHAWTFPPFRFIHFNISQSLALFYGRNRWDYYLTEGLPLLLTTAIPFALYAIYNETLNRLRPRKGLSAYYPKTDINQILAWTIIFVTLMLSLISHKEVRFLYPLLPALHLLAAPYLARFATPRKRFNFATIGILLLVNLTIGIYVTQVHQRGVIDVSRYLRSEFEDHFSNQQDAKMTVGFLMPCHSTPWRSHLVYAQIKGWALTCEPPLGVPLSERDSYLDEADQFYSDPAAWLKVHMKATDKISLSNDVSLATHDKPVSRNAEKTHGGIVIAEEPRSWPQYLVFFQQLEPFLEHFLASSPYQECWRGFNTHWHDDWRRKGDVIVWCFE